MYGSTRTGTRRALWPSIIVLAAILLGTQGSVTHAGRAATNMNVTLSVYTCCGSLAGFNDTNPGDLASMHTIYSGLWAKAFPGLRWKETNFADPAAVEARLASEVSAGTPPDMVFIQGNYIGDAVLRKLAQPLDQYFAQYHVSDSYFLPGMARWAHFGGHWWALPAVSGPLGGQYIYLPQYTTPLGYNNANLVTFNDYYQMSKKAVRFDAAGNLLRIGYWPGTNSWETIATLMCSPGHGLYDAHDQPTATDPCNVAYLSYLKQLVDLYGGYDKLRKFLSKDPDYLEGSRGSYFVLGKEIIPSTGYAYWNIPPLDTFGYGVQGGVRYQLTTMPVTAHGSLTEAANYPSTQQEIVIPRGAAHPDAAFAASKMLCWDYNYLLGRAVGGSPVVKSQNTWLKEVIAVEAATRQQAHLPGNPIATLKGVQMQPMLGLLSKAANPINPVDLAYQADLAKATDLVLYGRQTPEAALQGVQKQVLADQQKLRSQYGPWNW